jgi:hypothetical protein
MGGNGRVLAGVLFCFVLFCFAEMAWHGLGMEDTTDWAGIWEWCLASIDY